MGEPDHRACVSLLSSRQLNRRLMRFTLKLQGMDLTIKYRPGSTISNADGLSRQSWFDTEPIPGVYQRQTTGLSLAGGDVGLASERKRRARDEESKKEERRSEPN